MIHTNPFCDILVDENREVQMESEDQISEDVGDTNVQREKQQKRRNIQMVGIIFNIKE